MISLKARIVSASLYLFVRHAGELLGDVEGLQEESLRLANARHGKVVLVGEFADTRRSRSSFKSFRVQEETPTTKSAS